MFLTNRLGGFNSSASANFCTNSAKSKSFAPKRLLDGTRCLEAKFGCRNPNM